MSKRAAGKRAAVVFPAPPLASLLPNVCRARPSPCSAQTVDFQETTKYLVKTFTTQGTWYYDADSGRSLVHREQGNGDRSAPRSVVDRAATLGGHRTAQDSMRCTHTPLGGDVPAGTA